MGKLNPNLPSTPQRGNRRFQGISLIEVIIALSILGFGMLGIAAAQISAYRFTDSSRERGMAHGLAQQQLEIFQSMSSTALEAIRADGGYPNDPLNPIDPDTFDNTTMAFNRSWTITPDTPETGVYTIVVNVDWTGNAGAQTLQLESFKSEN